MKSFNLVRSGTKQPRKQIMCVPFILGNAFMSDEEYMKEALKEAQKAFDNNEVPIGAIIVYEGQIIGRGFNNRESSKQTDGHAEMMAIKQACSFLNSWKLDKCVMYVTLEPCPMCAGAILQSRIEKVFFAASDEKAGAFGSVMDLTAVQRLNHYPKLNKGILEEESQQLLKEFFKRLRNNVKR